MRPTDATLPRPDLVALVFALVLGACGGEAAAPAGTSGPCVGAKCDDPVATDTEGGTGAGTDTQGEPWICETRRSEAFDVSRPAFTPGAIRWSCNDVDGVPAVDRGQEYCDYFAVVALPDREPTLHGRIFSDDEGVLQETRTNLTDDERAVLDAMPPDTEVGACMFSSWFAEIDLPACTDCPDLFGLPVTADYFRTRQLNNTYRAAVGIVEACTQWEYEDHDDDFLRACLHVQNGAGVEWRKSDPILCAATLRMRECGCAQQDGGELGPAIAQRDAGGFPLGTWSDPGALPAGCGFVRVSEGVDQLLVACSMTAQQLLQNGTEIKDYCRRTYADNVVVHVPVDAMTIACMPSASDRYGDACTDTPWVVEPSAAD